MKVLLVGEIYSSNLGDQLIYLSVKDLTERFYPGSKISSMDIMCRKPLINHMTSKDCLNLVCVDEISIKDSIIKYIISKGYLFTIASAYSALKKRQNFEDQIKSNYDVAVFTGGALIQDIFVFYIYNIVSIFNKKRIAYVFNAVDYGTHNKLSILLWKKIFSFEFFKGISCRCKNKRICKIDHRLNIIETYDPVISYVFRNFKCIKGSKYVGLGVMNSSRFLEDEIINFWMDIIEVLRLRGVKWKIFTTGSESDSVLAYKVLKALNIEHGEDYLSLPNNPNELIDIIANFNGIISFRLHSHIISYALTIPSVGIVWDKKIEDFFEKIDRKNYIFSLFDNPVTIVERIIYAESISSSNVLRMTKMIESLYTQLLSKAVSSK